MSTAQTARAHRPDYVLALTVFILLAFGLTLMYNISPALSQKLLGNASAGYYFKGQLINIGAGLAAWAVAGSIYYERWRKWAPILLLGSIALVLMLMVPGLSYSKNGATRWLGVGSLSFQPAELLKLSLILYLASWFEARGKELRTFWDGVVPFAVMLFFTSIIVVVFQRDLGSMLVLACAATGMFYLAGIRLHHLFVLLGAGLGLGAVAIVAFSHRLSRFMTFLDPSKDATGSGYHINQALIGIGSGGLFGAGLGKSIQIYGYLPEASNDSIFAVIGEEFGIIGAVLIVILFGILVYRGFKIVQAAPDNFARLTAAGLTLVFMFQAFINIAAMLSLVPLTGIPLPFISYGGSSLVIMMFAAGILFNISKHTVKEAAYADSSQRRGIRGPHRPDTRRRRRLNPTG